jgi:hypothetical protein
MPGTVPSPTLDDAKDGWGLDSEASAAIIGAIIGLIGGIYPYWSNVRREKRQKQDLIRALRIGLSVELGHSLELIDEALREISAGRGYGGRLTSDHLEATRSKWCEYDQHEKFLSALPRVYRNITLTNRNLDALENLALKAQETGRHEFYVGYERFCPVVVTSLKVTRDTVDKLKSYLDRAVSPPE